MTSHFERWAKNYHHYIDPWYDRFYLLFHDKGFEAPTRRQFYLHCYKNSRAYYDPIEKKKVPPIVLTAMGEIDLS